MTLILNIIFNRKNIIMMLGKEDELLEKLQKCVGRLDGKPAATERYPQREPSRYSYGEMSNKKPLRQEKPERTNYFNQNKNQPSLDSRKPKWNMDQQNVYTPVVQYQYQPKSTRNSLSKNYLTERKYPAAQQDQPIQSQRRLQPADLKKKYEDQQNYAKYEPPKRTNNYVEISEKPRRPLREYEINVSTNNFSQNNIDIKSQNRSYLQEEKSYKKYEASSPKFEEYKAPENTQKVEIYRRNSVSYNEGYSRNMNKESSNRKNLDINKNSQNTSYRTKDYLSTPRQVEQFSEIGYPAKADRTNNNNENLQASISRDMSSQAKTRQAGIGSISSITKRPSLDYSKASFETFQPKEQKQLNLQKILNEVGSANQDTFSKLQKISELNERINMRIKNIIQTFEAK